MPGEQAYRAVGRQLREGGRPSERNGGRARTRGTHGAARGRRGGGGAAGAGGSEAGAPPPPAAGWAFARQQQPRGEGGRRRRASEASPERSPRRRLFAGETFSLCLAMAASAFVPLVA